MFRSFKKQLVKLGMEAHTGGSELEASLVYRARSRTARATENPCLEKPKRQTDRVEKPRSERGGGKR